MNHLVPILVVASSLSTATAEPPRGAESADRLSRMGATAQFVAHEAVSEPAAEAPVPSGPLGLLVSAERRASAAGRRVLATARRMMKRNVIVVGSCWDYANAVFERAGHPGKRGKRKTIFKGSRSRRRFADVKLIQPGDWLYYVNHQYRNVPHSAIFVAWLDRKRREALMITYRGARRRVPGVLDTYDLSSVYRIIRPSGG